MTRLRAKVVIEGKLKVLTGLHVGSVAAGMQIGSIDTPVVRDPISNYPYIPGSSLKGKLRSLLEATAELEGAEEDRYNRSHQSGGQLIRRHECDDREDALECPVCRLFGSTGSERGKKNHPARLAVADLLLTKGSRDELKLVETGLMYTEWKFENTLDRVTSAAMPRQLERVPAGSVFKMRLVYDDREDPDRLREDIQNLSRAMHLLEDDALGGHGSRGYGRVKFEKPRSSYRLVEEYGSGEEFEFEELNSIADLAHAHERAAR